MKFVECSLLYANLYIYLKIEVVLFEYIYYIFDFEAHGTRHVVCEKRRRWFRHG